MIKLISDFVSKFSKTPPPSPVDLVVKSKNKLDEGESDKQSGLQLKGKLIFRVIFNYPNYTYKYAK